ncbi:MAG: hypothetical protein ACRDHZ_16580 [Ktedonobacteraceae bacterium]
MESSHITAVEMAKDAGVDRRLFRSALRHAKLPWHHWYDRWAAPRGSERHKDMERVLLTLQRR